MILFPLRHVKSAMMDRETSDDDRDDRSLVVVTGTARYQSTTSASSNNRAPPRRIDHTYRDYSNFPTADLPLKAPNNFPSKLHHILSDPSITISSRGCRTEEHGRYTTKIVWSVMWCQSTSFKANTSPLLVSWMVGASNVCNRRVTTLMLTITNVSYEAYLSWSC